MSIARSGYRPRPSAAMVATALMIAVACNSGSTGGSTAEPGAKSEVTIPGGPRLVVASVVSITDGDTARMDFNGQKNQRVRFIGIDTPERGRPYFQDASDYASSQLLNKQVFLEFDVAHHDRFDRWLAYVWLEAPSSPSETEVRMKMFNARALLDGYAALLTVPPNVKYVNLLRGFQAEAREAGRGLWSLQP